jgi:hypothetical protein
MGSSRGICGDCGEAIDAVHPVAVIGDYCMAGTSGQLGGKSLASEFRALAERQTRFGVNPWEDIRQNLNSSCA